MSPDGHGRGLDAALERGQRVVGVATVKVMEDVARQRVLLAIPREGRVELIADAEHVGGVARADHRAELLRRDTQRGHADGLGGGVGLARGLGCGRGGLVRVARGGVGQLGRVVRELLGLVCGLGRLLRLGCLVLGRLLRLGELALARLLVRDARRLARLALLLVRLDCGLGLVRGLCGGVGLDSRGFQCRLVLVLKRKVLD